MSKQLNFIFAGIFSLILLASFASAADLSISNVNAPASVDEDAGSFSVTFNLTYTGTTANKSVYFNQSSLNIGSISISDIIINPNGSKILTATISNFAGKGGNTLTGFIIATNSSGVNETSGTFSTIITKECDDFCSECELAGNPGDLYLTNLDFSVEKGFGDDENYWYPFDEVEITFEIKNKGNWDVENIELEICLWDKTSNECAVDEKDMDLSDDEVDIDEDDDGIDVTVNFLVDPDELTEGDTDYILYVRAFGQIDDNNAGILDGNDTCVFKDQDIEIRTDEKFVIIRNFDAPEIVKRGETVEITADVWNIGEDRIDSEDLFIEVRSGTLGFVETIDLDDLKSFDSDKISFSLPIPVDAEEKTHVIKLTVYDDEDMEDNDIYENQENDEAVYDFFITVQGGKSLADTISISAALETPAQSGETAVATIDLTNLGESLESYTISISGYNDWASSAELSKTSLALAAGNSDLINVTFQIKEDVSGEQTFNVNVLSPTTGKVILTQPVTISISEKSKFSFSRILGENWYLWLIGIFNVILIIIIIIVAIKIANS